MLKGALNRTSEYQAPPSMERLMIEMVVDRNSGLKGKLKGKVHPKNMLVSDVRSDKIGKNAIDRFSISPLVLKIFAFKVEELVIWRQLF